jgi:hypothetical protein
MVPQVLAIPQKVGRVTKQFDLFDRREARFAEFDAANPDVWRLFERFTLELIRRGFEHYSSDAVLHRVRWETAVSAKDGTFKIDNNWTPYFARKFHSHYPQYAGFFRTRLSKFDAEAA